MDVPFQVVRALMKRKTSMILYFVLQHLVKMFLCSACLKEVWEKKPNYAE